jgi:hypothetical protein
VVVLIGISHGTTRSLTILSEYWVNVGPYYDASRQEIL